jgi:hypothetical protein
LRRRSFSSRSLGSTSTVTFENNQLKQRFNSDLFWLVTSQEAVVLHLVLMDLEDSVPRSVAMVLVPVAAVMVVYLCNPQTPEQKQRGWLPTAIRFFSS